MKPPLTVDCQASAGEQDGAEEVHEGSEEAEPRGQRDAAVRQAVRQPQVLRLERHAGAGGGAHSRGDGACDGQTGLRHDQVLLRPLRDDPAVSDQEEVSHQHVALAVLSVRP